MINDVAYYSDGVKKIDVTLPINSTLFELKQQLAKQLDITWQEIRIVGKKELDDLLNCRTIKELRLDPSDTFTVSRRALPTYVEAEIIIDDKIQPKALRVFTKIF
eukprot:GHVR01045542.1.p1 GENE.GHVR01045542.1~~GHVR01045542.1.p1  ORF type:complete len:105 (-),score=15.45 GHVR01045542.1:4450-4764(-)